MELLSPAGNLLSAYSAFKGGADAIYIGGKQFSARASADNFSNEEMKEIVFFAHSIGKKVYVTLNTLLFQDEFFAAVEFAKFLYEINVDGVIIQDLGLAHYLHQVLPNLSLNASTQLNCHNLEQAKALIKIGFKRIVLGRETNLDTVRAIKNLGVEVEVFGHGALCVSYSGNCLLSSFVGDRSGNRGRCAQPCRMRYDLIEDGIKISEQKFHISTKDLMTIDSIPEIIDAGVDSLKIEGRLKSNEYIYAVSNAYRHAIDNALANKHINLKDDKETLTKIFNRQFTKGFILNESPFNTLNSETSSHQGQAVGKVIKVKKDRISILLCNELHRLDGIRFNGKEQIGLTVEKMFLNKEPVEMAGPGKVIELSGIEHTELLDGQEVIKTKDYVLVKQIEQELKKQIKVKISASVFCFPNSPISLTASFNGISITVKGDVALEAEGNGTSEERLADQLKKSGDYPYIIDSLKIKMSKCFVPISAINDLRNRAFNELKKALIKTNNVEENEYKTLKYSPKNTTKRAFFVENVKQNETVQEAGFFAYSPAGEIYKNYNRITRNDKFNAPFSIVHFVIEKTANNYLIASQYCSITNSYALDCYFYLGFDECILSPELDCSSISALLSDYKNRNGIIPNVGLIVYGKLDMMIMRSCPVGTFFNNKGLHCERCHHKRYELIDRVGEKYHLIGDSDCNTRLLNNKPIYLLDRLQEIKELEISNLWLILTDESKEKVELTMDNLDNPDNKFDRYNFTRGHFNNRPL